MQLEPAAKDRLAFLDAARGVAALLVVLEHGLDNWFPAYVPWSLTRVNLGQVGVTLFFLISGFIIPASLCQGGSQARFWLRRFFRLFPLYWTVIALTWVYAVTTGDAPGGIALERTRVWLTNLTMLQAFVGQPHLSGVFWTLHFELLIYAACSALFLLGLLKRPVVVAGLVLAVYLVDGAIWRPLVVGNAFSIGGRMFIVLAPLFGAVFESCVAGNLSRRALLCYVACFYLGVTAIFAINTAMYPESHGKHSALWSLCGPWSIAFTGFALLVMVRRAVRPGFLAWAGRISYSVYLAHPLVLLLLMATHWPAGIGLPALFAGTLLLSAGTFTLVEKPGIALGRAVEKICLGPRIRLRLGPAVEAALTRQAQSMPTWNPCSVPDAGRDHRRESDRA